MPSAFFRLATISPPIRHYRFASTPPAFDIQNISAAIDYTLLPSG